MSFNYYAKHAVNGKIEQITQIESLPMKSEYGMEITREEFENVMRNMEGYFIQYGFVVPRPVSPVTLTGMLLEGIPLPATLIINETEYVLSESSVEMDFAYPGVYSITVKSFPYLDANFEVTV